jgi:hypothetical protein
MAFNILLVWKKLPSLRLSGFYMLPRQFFFVYPPQHLRSGITFPIIQPVQIPCYGDAVAQLFGDCRIRIGGQQYPKVAGGLSLGVTADFFPGAAGNGLNVLLSGKCNDPGSARELTHLNPSRL